MKTKKNRRLTFTCILCLLTVLSAFSQTGNLSVGAARVDITPPVRPGYEPSGKYDHEKLNVRAIVLDNGITRAALIGCDLADVTDPVWEGAAPQIAAELDCPIDNIIMSPSHSHSACQSGPPPPRFNEIDVQKTVGAMVRVVKEAKSKLQPARVGFGTGSLYLNANRDAINKKTRLWTQEANLEGPSDKTLAVVLFTDLEGKPIAGYMNYAMHAVNAFLTGITSADFPGAACRYIEKAFSDEMVMIFTQGASGDQNPLWLRPGTNVLASMTGIEITGYELTRQPIESNVAGNEKNWSLDPQLADNLERYIDALGVIMGEEAIRVMTNIENLENNVRIWGTHKVITLPGRTRTNTGREGMPGTYVDGDSVDIRLGMLGLSNIALTSIDSEIYNIYARELKKASPMTNTVFVTISNGRTNSGYIIPDSDYGKNTFQVLGNKLQPGYAEKVITEVLVNLIENYISQ